MLKLKPNKLDNYRELIGDEKVEELYDLAAPLDKKEIVHVNTSLYEGGIAMILSSLIPLMNELGISTEWHQVKGKSDFFVTTKMIQNALQGADIELSDRRKKVYLEVNEENAIFTHFEYHDCVIIHDSQPLPLISYFKKKQPWIWRWHLDLSRRNQAAWNYLLQFILKYDHLILSHSQDLQKVQMPQSVIMPAIDPYSYVNQELKKSDIEDTLKKYEIEHDKPIIAQISRFDRWKDPLGVVDVFKKVKEKVDCKLILLGNIVQSDEEGHEIYEELITNVREIPDVQVLTIQSNFLVNALQREADVIIQKSIREGFGLTVSETMWKETPIVASNVGGIPYQIIDGKTGYLVNNIEECANRVVKLLKNPKLAQEMGKNGKEYVRKQFLITRQLEDYVKLLRLVLLHYRV